MTTELPTYGKQYPLERKLETTQINQIRFDLKAQKFIIFDEAGLEFDEARSFEEAEKKLQQYARWLDQQNKLSEFAMPLYRE